MTRVWLSEWEWACCGDAFAIGDSVDFGIETRSPVPVLGDMIGPALVVTVDAIESHHESEFNDRIRGRVTAVHAVTLEVIERRSVRRPGHGAPPVDGASPDPEWWSTRGRDAGNGVFARSRPSRYVIEIVRVPDTAALEPAHGVRLAVAEHEAPSAAVSEHANPPPERRTRSRVGWLVDVEGAPPNEW